MDPNLDRAKQKRDQAALIEQTAANIRGQGSESAASSLDIEASNLRVQADQEEIDATTRSAQEKSDIDLKYGTT